MSGDRSGYVHMSVTRRDRRCRCVTPRSEVCCPRWSALAPAPVSS